MRRFLTLFRAGLRANFGLAVLRYRILVEKKDRWLVPLLGAAGLAVLPSVFGLVLLVQNIYLVLKPLGQERALLTLGVLGGEFFILLFGLYYVISAFYFSRDLEFLVPLPLKPFEVIASKFAVIMVNEYLTVMVIVLPVLVGYGVLARGGVSYWINSLLVYLLLPVIPLAIVSFLVVALMRVVNIGRKKDALILAGSILLIGLSLAIQLAARQAGDRETAGRLVTDFLASPDSLLNRVGSRFPPSIWAAKAIAGGFSASGLRNLGLFAGASLALFAGILFVSEKLFYRGLVGLGEVAARRRSLSRLQMSRKLSSGRHPVRAVFVREWRIMNRTPIFLLNGVLVVVLIPVILAVMVQTGAGKGSGGAVLKLMTSAPPIVVILAAAAFMVVCGCLNGTASSAFSREGGQFWISKVIPVAPREQAAAKFLHSYLISLLGTASASVVAAWAFRVGAAPLAAAAGLSLAAAVPLTAIGMMIDLARPLLDWTNPQKAIKQNLNVLLALCADIGFLTVLFFGVVLSISAGFPAAAILAALFAILTALAALSCAALAKFAEKRYGEIEV